MSIELEFAAADVFGLTPLAARALSGRTDDLGLVVPRQLDAIPRPDTTLFDPPRRAELAARLEAKLTERGSHVRTLEAVRKLRAPGATCVIAGQQPGLFGGPAFNTFKALHVVRLAHDLEQLWGTPVVPILWNHADDHDIAEVHHAWFVNDQQNLVKVGLPGASSGRRPLSEFRCDAQAQNLDGLASRLRDLHAAGLDRDVVALAVPRDGESLAEAWTRLHLELFGHLGLVVLEPDWIRTDLSEALADVVAPHPVRELRAASERLAKAGLEPAIDPEQAALVFQLRGTPSERHALRPGGDGWTFDDEAGSRTPSELAAEIVKAKARYTAGALLRPVAQDLALPTAAYVGGFGELAYHVQLAELRERVGLGPAVFVPRLSATLTDARLRTSLRHLKRSAAEYLRAPDLAAAPVHQVDPGLADRLDDGFRDFKAALMGEHDAIGAIDPGLAGQLRKALAQSKKSVDALAKRIRNIEGSATGSDRRHMRRVAAHLRPRDEPQERILTTTQLASKWGRSWIDELFAALEPLPSEHWIVHVDPHG